MTPDANDLCVFAVKRGYIESKEIYCNPLYPTYLSLVEKYQHSPYANGILNNHVAVNPKTDCSLLSDSSEVSFVPMANVQEKTNVVSYDMVAYETVKKGRIDADYYSPKFSHFRSQIEALPYRTVSVDDISEKIVSGFAAGKQDQADNLPEDQRVPHLRPFSITPEGELSFETKKYVPKSRLKSEDYCKKNEVIFNNTNSPDLVGKTTVFDSDVLCAASNHMTRITVKEGVNPYYVAAFFNVLLSIDYFSKVAMSFFANHGYDTEGFTINPYMVVNKVFSSYYKHVQFPIVTFDELKREIQL